MILIHKLIFLELQLGDGPNLQIEQITAGLIYNDFGATYQKKRGFCITKDFNSDRSSGNRVTQLKNEQKMTTKRAPS